MKLVIVESPAKAKTIERFLGPEYRVEASFGHIRDLPRSAKETPKRFRDKAWGRLGVDVEGDFEPVYVVPEASRRHVRKLERLLADADEVLLATDEDREGESISWHLVEVLNPRIPVRRIAFHEITPGAVAEALANPRSVDRRLVRAQEARRVLDRLFGYELSPVLWKKVRTKLSAGRVQSVALRLLVEREEERRRFRAAVHWGAEAALVGDGREFSATLARVDGRRVAVGKDFDPATGRLRASSKALALDEDAARAIATGVMENTPWRVERAVRKSVRQRPAPPFTTSTLQQAASSRLRMSPRRTMRLAQRLYEGVNLGGGDREGLITYMRTDSVTLSAKALRDAGECVASRFGPEYHDGPRRYRTKSKIAQEAHEAIRPTEMKRAPDALKRILNSDELALYGLIWSRAIASQMTDARIDQTSVDLVARVDAVEHVFRASGSVLRFPGFLKVYGTKREDQLLPPLEEGDEIRRAEPDADPDGPARVRAVEPRREETKPPARYSEASLVKKLEEEGIGRPSTYTPTISTIQDRDYARRRGGALTPTFLGMAVVQLLREHFGRYVDVGFTARMEDALDDIAAGDRESRRFLETFYRGEGDHLGLVRRIAEALPGIDYPSLAIGQHPRTGQDMAVRIGVSSVYVACGEGDEARRATVPPDVAPADLTPERAAEILDARSGGDRQLGRDPENDEPVYVRIGPYGPYVQRGEVGKGRPKPHWVGLPREVDPATVELDVALKFLALPRLLGDDPETGKPVTASMGPYGPYVKRAKEYRNLDSADAVFAIGLAEALALLAAKPKRSRSVIKSLGDHPDGGGEIVVLKGRYGPYVTDDRVNASVPRDRNPEDVTLEEAVAMLAAAAERRKKRPQRRRSKARAR